MRFVKDGPDLPDRLMQAHEDGRVVLFCGAGVSYPAGLPDFRGLTSAVFDQLGVDPTPDQKSAMKRMRYDIAFDLLEKDVNDRIMVRQKIHSVLTPQSTTMTEVASIHKVILSLAKSNDGCVRLVTTNFDRLFVEAERDITIYTAPFLPIPKKSKWNGVVHLHGLLPKADDANALNSLVVSSGDFGLAYLVERWASRFVSELFRNYVVCFVGYSVGDPVLRYMVDALAADRLLGEDVKEVFSFAPYSKKSEQEEKQYWRTKGMVPIFYSSRNKHRLLHETLREWAALYRDGLTGRHSIITRESVALPSHDLSDGHIDRVLWALADRTGASAKTFATLKPVPPLEWLDELTLPRYRVTDFFRGGEPDLSSDPKLFSLLDRPLYSNKPTRVSLVSMTEPSSLMLDEAMFQIGRWLCHHIGEQKLIAWVIKNGCHLHPEWRDQITKTLNGDRGDIPVALLKIWRLICLGLARSRLHHSGISIYGWVAKLKQKGWTFFLKKEFLLMLHPIVELSESIHCGIEGKQFCNDRCFSGKPGVEHYADWEIVLGIGEQPWKKVEEIKQHSAWSDIARQCLPEFTQCLHEVLELKSELGGVSWKSDLTYVDRPSIEDDSRNNNFRDWTVLIVLCRDAWRILASQDPPMALLEFDKWNSFKFPVFKRLTFHAATQTPLIDSSRGLSSLLQDNSWWLWSPETRRESLQLIAHLAEIITTDQRDELAAAILAGPPVEMFRPDIDKEESRAIGDSAIWLRLKTWERTGAEMTHEAHERLRILSAQFPDWQLDADDGHQFPYRMGAHSDIASKRSIRLSRKIEDLAGALKVRPTKDDFYDDDWKEICRMCPTLAIAALKVLAEDQCWNSGAWRIAFQVFAESEYRLESLKELGQYLVSLTEEALLSVQHSYTWWLRRLASDIDMSLEAQWLQLLDRTLDYVAPEGAAEILLEDDQVQSAINNPIAVATEALIERYSQTEPSFESGFPDRIKIRFMRASQPKRSIYAPGRIIMARHLAWLYTIDPAWISTSLLPFLNWSQFPQVAKGVWQGFLQTARLSPELLDAFKSQFLETAHHYSKLAGSKSNYAAILTVGALEFDEHFSKNELRRAFLALPADGLAEAANMVSRAMKGAAEKRQEYWSHRVKPLFERIWPKSGAKRSDDESVELASICIRANLLFPEALKVLGPLLRKTTRYYLPVIDLAESELSTTFPRQSLSLISAIVNEDEVWPPDELWTCLNSIKAAAPELADDARFKSLEQYCKRNQREV